MAAAKNDGWVIITCQNRARPLLLTLLLAHDDARCCGRHRVVHRVVQQTEARRTEAVRARQRPVHAIVLADLVALALAVLWQRRHLVLVVLLHVLLRRLPHGRLAAAARTLRGRR
jgi:hypothetical protein